MKTLKKILSVFILLLTFVHTASAVDNYTFHMPANPLSPSGTLTASMVGGYSNTGVTWNTTNYPVACTIALNASTCNATFSWTTSSTTANSRVRIYNASTYASPGYPNTSIQQGNCMIPSGSCNSTTANLSGSNVSATIPFGASDIELYDIRSTVANQPDPNNNQWYLFKITTRPVSAACVSGTVWSGTTCASPTGSITTSSVPWGASSYGCFITNGNNTCNVNVTWTSSGLASPIVTQNGTQFSTNPNGTAVPRPLSLGGPSLFYLYDGSTFIAQASASPLCDYANYAAPKGDGYCVVPAGTITASNCIIPIGSSSCNSNVTWSLSNILPAQTYPSVAVKKDGTTFSTARSSAGTAVSMSYGSHTFDFFDMINISTANATATCANNSTWNGTICNASTGTITATNCVIAANASTCNSNVSWSTTGTIYSLGIYQGGTQFSTATSQSPAIPRAIPYGSFNSFSIYSINGVNTALIAITNATATCAANTTWNGSSCSSASITSDPVCTILANASDCTVDVTWASNSLGSPIIKQDGVQFSTSANQSTPVARTISNGSHTFRIYDGASLIATSNSSAVCEYGTTWDPDTGCVPFSTASIMANPPDCLIRTNASTCDADVVWMSANLLSPSIKQNGTQFSTNANQATSIQRAVSYGSTTFEIFDGATLYDSSRVNADCTLPDTWDGTACTSSNASITSDPTCTIPTGGSGCNVDVSWSSTGLTKPSVEVDGIMFSNTPSSPPPSGMPMTINYGTHVFTISDAGSVLNSSTSIASCDPADTWDGTICKANKAPPGGGGTTTATATLSANPTKVDSGKPSVLTWGSTGATYCTGNGFNTSNATSGTATVKPKTTTTYSVACFDSSGNGATANAKVTVGKIKTIYSEN